MLKEAKFYGAIDLRKGEIIKILRAFPDNGSLVRATFIENLTTGQTFKSRYDGIMAANPSVDLPDPIIGKVLSSNNKGHETLFEFIPGMYQDHVFVKAGEKQKGQNALIDILKNQLDTYVKICDPYTSRDTIRLVSNVPPGINILILTDNIIDINQVKNEIYCLNNKVSIRRGAGLHDRYILTKGEGWSVGHSLKDFGSKNSQLIKMVSPVEAEDAYDENWNVAALLIER